MIRTTCRRSRQPRLCDSCRSTIGVRDRYLEHVTSPHHDDLCNPHWWRIVECRDCATRYGRAATFEEPT